MKIPYCFTGLVQTLEGIIELWDDLKTEQSYLLLGHLNTDHKENLYSMIRMNRGSYEKPLSVYVCSKIETSNFSQLEVCRKLGVRRLRI